MRSAGNYLDEMAAQTAEAGEPSGEAAGFQRARAAANSVLARDEFRAAEGPGWLDRQVARLEDWLGRLFMGMEGVGARNPWLAPLIEWRCFALAAAGLVFFVRRSLARQSLRIALGERGGRTAAGA